MITKSSFDFLTELKANNNRDWFTANKARYEAAKDEFVVFMDGLIKNIAVFDKSVEGVEVKNCVFRIYRDVRFSKDKTPYQTYLGGHIIAGGRGKNEHSRSGYYVRLQPGESVLAGGAYLPPGPWINAIRQEIDYNTAEFKALINGADFKKYFGEIEGEKLKNVPKGYAKDHPEAELLKYKSFLAVHKMNEKQALDKNLLMHATAVFKTLYPFGEFLNRAV